MTQETLHRDALQILILGGTTESFELAETLGKDPRYAPVLSLAGVTRSPRFPSIASRVGGFGGIEGLVRYVEQFNIRLLIAGTHPFAAQMRCNAIEAARIASIPVLILERPAWQATTRDVWAHVADMSSAATALGISPRRVLLTMGRKELAAFAAHPHHHYVVRTIDAPPREHLPADAELILARGPFTESAERDLLISRHIDVVVTKNSGGSATEAKLIAARTCGIPVIMVNRPPMPALEGVDAHIVSTIDSALKHVEARHHGLFSTERGV